MQKSTAFLLVFALAGAGVSAGLWTELRAERALNAELTERLTSAISTAAAPTPVSPTPSPSPETPAAAPPPAPAPIPATAPAEPGPVQAKATQDRRDDWQARQRRLMSDPKYREAWKEQQRIQLAQRRDNYIQLLGFTPEQADAAIDLAIDRQMSMYDRAQFSGTMEEAQRWQERQKAEEAAHQAKLRDLLGESKAAKLQTYMESRQSRMQVDRFRNQLSGADSLRDDQVEPLITALHTEQAQMQKEMQEFRETMSDRGESTDSARKYAERQTELMKGTHQRMHSAASGILSPSQLDRLDAMLKRDLERQEAQQRMQRIQSKLEPPPEASGSN